MISKDINDIGSVGLEPVYIIDNFLLKNPKIAQHLTVAGQVIQDKKTNVCWSYFPTFRSNQDLIDELKKKFFEEDFYFHELYYSQNRSDYFITYIFGGGRGHFGRKVFNATNKRFLLGAEIVNSYTNRFAPEIYVIFYSAQCQTIIRTGLLFNETNIYFALDIMKMQKNLSSEYLKLSLKKLNLPMKIMNVFYQLKDSLKISNDAVNLIELFAVVCKEWNNTSYEVARYKQVNLFESIFNEEL